MLFLNSRFQMRRYVFPLWSHLPHGTMGQLLPTHASQLGTRQQEVLIAEVKIWVNQIKNIPLSYITTKSKEKLFYIKKLKHFRTIKIVS